MQGVLYWITGLSGAGKTTIGNKLYYTLKEKHDNVILLDGDVLKKIFSDTVGYSNEARRIRANQYARLCKILTDQGLIVICCTIAMFDEVRAWNRKNNKAYVEVFLDVPMEVIKERDQKGMYSRYAKGNFSEIAGLDVEIELPKNPDIIIKNDGTKSVWECVEMIMNHQIKCSDDFDRDTEYWNGFYQGKPGRANFKFIVVGLAIESALNVTAQVGAVLNPHALGVVNLNCYLVILADDNVYQKILLVGQPFIGEVDYLLSVNHIVYVLF